MGYEAKAFQGAQERRMAKQWSLLITANHIAPNQMLHQYSGCVCSDSQRFAATSLFLTTIRNYRLDIGYN